jgi:cytoskeletal protein RodZ
LLLFLLITKSTGNIWVAEEESGDDDDHAIFIFTSSNHSREKMRWWASWFLFAAYLPILFLYCVWIPLTLTGRVREAKDTSSNPEHNDSVREAGLDMSIMSIDDRNENVEDNSPLHK